MKLLFVCTHNACRSVLSEVIGRRIAGDRLQTASAGSQPSGQIHPLTLRFLQSQGYSTDGLLSKGFADVEFFDPDVVITVCDRAAEEACPVWLGNAVKVHWGLPDPSHMEGSDTEVDAAFTAIAATIGHRIEALLAERFESLSPGELTALFNKIAGQY